MWSTSFVIPLVSFAGIFFLAWLLIRDWRQNFLMLSCSSKLCTAAELSNQDFHSYSQEHVHHSKITIFGTKLQKNFWREVTACYFTFFRKLGWFSFMCWSLTFLVIFIVFKVNLFGFSGNWSIKCLRCTCFMSKVGWSWSSAVSKDQVYWLRNWKWSTELISKMQCSWQQQKK